jgi:hypothetical protein
MLLLSSENVTLIVQRICQTYMLLLSSENVTLIVQRICQATN